MKNYTPTRLKEDIEYYNKLLAGSGSTYSLEREGRNGYQAVDLYRVYPEGDKRCESLLEAGTSRKCMLTALMWTRTHAGYIFPQNKGELTRQQAKVVLQGVGIDFSNTFFVCTGEEVEWLLTWAKLTKYRAPDKDATAFYFFTHLKTKIK